MLKFQEFLNQLEEKRIGVLKAIDVNFTSNEIETCHFLEKKKCY